MALTLQTWKVVVDKKWATSASFKQLDQAVRAYLLNSDPSTLLVLKQRWDAWNLTLANKKGAKTYQTSDRYVAGCALDDLDAMFQIPASSSGFPAIRSQAELIRQRDALSDERSGEFVKVSGKWQKKIFTQQESESCTCACATTFLAKLDPTIQLKEEVFKREFDKQIGGHHDFSSSGTFFPNIVKTLVSFGADVEHQATTDRTDLLAKLSRATKQVPILFGVSWTGGGGHAVMCMGPGQVQFSTLTYPFQGFLIEDPAAEHEEPGMESDGHYWAKIKGTGNWSEGWANPTFGCVVGKAAQRIDRGKNISHLKGGIRVM